MKGLLARRFYIVSRLGYGGMSVVNLALDVEHYRFVALKSLFSDVNGESEYRNRFRREISIYRHLSHMNIVSLYDARCDDEMAYMALEYVHGRNLSELIREGDLHLKAVFRIMEGLVNAVFHAHSRGIIHRDIQPNNVIVAEDGEPCLIDFGIAYMEDELVHTTTGTIMGTFVYCSPEQNQGKQVDERSDLYSLGTVFYELLTGKRAIKGDTLLQIIEYQLKHEIPPPSELRPDIPAPLDSLVMKLLERWPENRFQSARQLLDELLQLKLSLFSEMDELLSGDEEALRLRTALRALKARRYDVVFDMCAPCLESADENASPRCGEFLMLAAMAFKESGRYDEAARSFERGFAVLNRSPSRRERLEYALVQLACDRQDEALKTLDELLLENHTDVCAAGLKEFIHKRARGVIPVACIDSDAEPVRRRMEAGVSPWDRSLDVLESTALLNAYLDRLNPETALLFSSVFCGLGDLYNGNLRGGLKNLVLALSLAALGTLLLTWTPPCPIDPQSGLAPYLDAETRYVLHTSGIDIALRSYLADMTSQLAQLLSVPFFTAFVFVWIRNRNEAFHFHRKRKVFGRISELPTSSLMLLKLNTTVMKDEEPPADSYLLVEESPASPAGTNRRRCGTAKVLFTEGEVVHCRHLKDILYEKAPAVGDVALPWWLIREYGLIAPQDEGRGWLSETTTRLQARWFDCLMRLVGRFR